MPSQPRAAVAIPPRAMAIALTALTSSRADCSHSLHVRSLTATFGIQHQRRRREAREARTQLYHRTPRGHQPREAINGQLGPAGRPGYIAQHAGDIIAGKQGEPELEPRQKRVSLW
jgi:hypothetical protein